jgi:hypothetical protein
MVRLGLRADRLAEVFHRFRQLVKASRRPVERLSPIGHIHDVSQGRYGSKRSISRNRELV